MSTAHPDIALQRHVEVGAFASDNDQSPTQSIAKAIAADLEQHYLCEVPASSITEIASSAPALLDSTHKFLCPAPPKSNDDKGFLILSGSGNPKLVARGVANIAAIRARLPLNLLGPVLAPVATGDIDGFSYAVWPMRRSLSQMRLVFEVRKRQLAPSLFDWLFKVCTASAAQPENDESVHRGFISPLRFIQSDQRQPAAIREAAEHSLNRLADKSWSPRHCIQHSDFWIGNVLTGRSQKNSPRFYVIDWAGALMDGYPFMDLVRLSISIGAGEKRRKAEFNRYCAQMGCDHADAAGYILCGLGSLGENLEHFPEETYLSLCRRMFAYAQPRTL